METFGLIYLTLAIFSFFEMKLLVEETLLQLKKDIQVVAKFSVGRGYDDPALCNLEGLEPYLEVEKSRSMKIVLLCSMFFAIVIIPSMMLDRSAFADGFIQRYKMSARNRILNNLP